ncbi:MAG: hypothetical protein GXO77_10370 [Calditrichaeota bacterium]|nr:hypothetical protein [Calditrichota bacterium]
MAKKQDFASKTQKGKHGKTCPVCGEVFTYVKKVNMLPSQKEGAYGFAEKIVAVCKCNEKEVYA